MSGLCEHRAMGGGVAGFGFGVWPVAEDATAAGDGNRGLDHESTKSRNEDAAAADAGGASAEQRAEKKAAREGAAKGGRPRFLDEKKQAEICAMLAAGCTFRAAAQYVGCTSAAVSALLSRDAGFREKAGRALAEREAIPLAHLRAASKKSWRAAAWLLERTVKGPYRRDNLTDPTSAGDAVDSELRDFLSDEILTAQSRECLEGMAERLAKRSED